MKIGFLIFPGITTLDLVGPHDVLARLPGATTCLIAKTAQPVQSDLGLTLTPNATFENAPELDVLVVPGGPGVNPLLNDRETLAYVTKAADKAKHIVSVCTGSLILGAAGLLKDHKATTHWMSHHFLEKFGAQPINARVVIDRKMITGAGVTSGIDLGLIAAEKIAGSEEAKRIQLFLEYDPQPPFKAGSPEQAGESTVATVREKFSATMKTRAVAVDSATLRLEQDTHAALQKSAGYCQTIKPKDVSATAISVKAVDIRVSRL